ncbi:hypothetical protein MRX96_011693 [Rhipicephalus microplus]
MRRAWPVPPPTTPSRERTRSRSPPSGHGIRPVNATDPHSHRRASRCNLTHGTPTLPRSGSVARKSAWLRCTTAKRAEYTLALDGGDLADVVGRHGVV